MFARVEGAVAAPTAGLHLSAPLLEALSAGGVGSARIVLHVGPGTFRPITAEDPREHRMDEEYFELADRVMDEIESRFEWLSAGELEKTTQGWPRNVPRSQFCPGLSSQKSWRSPFLSSQKTFRTLALLFWKAMGEAIYPLPETSLASSAGCFRPWSPGLELAATDLRNRVKLGFS